MKRLCYLLAAFGAAACSEAESVFYAADYPVTGMGVEVRQEEEGTPLTEAQFEALVEAVAADAPVQVGGSYRTEFDRYDGGVLRVATAEGAEPIVGTFTKQPAAKQMTFAYGDQIYTVRTEGYAAAELPADAAERTAFRVDVTERYIDRFDAACRITQIDRLELTARPFHDLND